MGVQFWQPRPPTPNTTPHKERSPKQSTFQRLGDKMLTNKEGIHFFSSSNPHASGYRWPAPFKVAIVLS